MRNKALTFEEQAKQDAKRCAEHSSPTTGDKYGIKTKRGGTIYFKSKEQAERCLQKYDDLFTFVGWVEPIC